MNADDVPTIVYTMENCPECKRSKRLLKEKGISFVEKDMTDPDVKTDLNMDNIFPMTAPVILFEGNYLMSYSELAEAL